MKKSLKLLIISALLAGSITPALLSEKAFADGETFTCYNSPSFLIKNNTLTYLDGSAIEPDTNYGISWDGINKLTLDNADVCTIKFDNGNTPINVVLVGENDLRIESETTPIVISGDGSLTSSDGDGGTCPGSPFYGMIKANNTSLTLNGGALLECPIMVGDLTVNGGSVEETNIDFYGTELEINGGKSEVYFRSDSKTNITVNDGTVVLGTPNTNGGEVIVNGGEVLAGSEIKAKTITINDGEVIAVTDGGFIADAFIMNGGDVKTQYVAAQYYFAMNGGDLTISGIELGDTTAAPTIVVASGFAEFNGGTVDIFGTMPMTVQYYSNPDESTKAIFKELLGDNYEIPTAGISFNGGDINIEVITEDNAMEKMSEAYELYIILSSRFEYSERRVSQICKNVESVNQEIEEMYNMAQASDQFIPFEDSTDCEGRFLDSLSEAQLAIVRNEIQEMADAGQLESLYNSIPLLVMVEDLNGTVEESAVYIDDSLTKDPNEFTVQVATGTINSRSGLSLVTGTFHEGQESTVTIVTFGDGEDVSFLIDDENEVYTSEHALLRAHIYKEAGSDPEPDVPDTDDDGEEAETAEDDIKASETGFKPAEKSSGISAATTSTFIGVIIAFTSLFSYAIYRSHNNSHKK